jgi:hypothetical protein
MRAITLALAWPPTVAFLAFLALSTQVLASGAGLFDREGVLPEMDSCRFLNTDTHSEQREALSEERIQTLERLLRKSAIGDMVATALTQYAYEGIGPEQRRVEFFEVQRQSGPVAAYFERGQMHFSSRLFIPPSDNSENGMNHLYTAASFVVHEGVHALAHHLHLMGWFPAYRADTKVNEALAYFVQGLYLDEIREQVPTYQETRAVPVWDRCTRQIAQILTQLDISPESDPDAVYDQFAELQLESDAVTALRWERLWQYFLFMQESGESEQLWSLGTDEPEAIEVVRFITDMVAGDVEQRHCNFDETFAFMRNRIILYAHYPDTPLGVRACQYFVDFVLALREDPRTTSALRDRIDLWLLERGLVTEDSGRYVADVSGEISRRTEVAGIGQAAFQQRGYRAPPGP